MGGFRYQGYDKNGDPDSGTLDAATEKLAFEILQSREITVFDLRPEGTEIDAQLPWYRRDIQFGASSLSFDDQATVAELLSVLFASGISERDVLRVAVTSTNDRRVKKHLERSLYNLENGDRLADAFGRDNVLFSSMFVAFLRLGENANALSTALNSLASFLRKQDQARQKISSALIYPSILIAAAVALLGVVTFYLAPNLAPMFAAVDRSPPAALSFLLKMNEWLQTHWPILLAVGVALVFTILAALGSSRLRNMLSGFVERLPILGHLLRTNELMRLTQAVVLLLGASASLPTALRTAASAMAPGTRLGTSFNEAASALDKGMRATDVFSADKSLPAEFVELFRIGEETNRLPDTLAAVSASLSSRVDRQTQRLLALLTPAITLILGVGIGVLVYTIMGAILEVNEIAF